MLSADRKELHKGDWVNGNLHGHGTHKRRDGCKYVGQFNHGYWEGTGVLKSPEGKVLYDGKWEKGVKHGRGTETQAEIGSTYTGQFRGGFKHGVGVVTAVNPSDKGVVRRFLSWWENG